MAFPDDVHVEFTSPLGDKLHFRHMHGEEALGQPFNYELSLLSKTGDFGLGDLLGKPVTVKLALPNSTAPSNEKIRFFNGYVARFSRQGMDGDYHVYSATVRPWIWLLSHATNCRIFQDQTVPEIIKDVFRAHGLTDIQPRLSGQYAKHDFTAQYRETDLNFVTRLMEDEGIYYYFTHELDKHTLVLADSYSAHQKVKGYEEVPYIVPGDMRQSLPDHITSWENAQQIQAGNVVMKDFNFENPKNDLLVTRSAPNAHAKADFEHYDYPGDYLSRVDGETYVRLRLEELNARYEQTTGNGNPRGLNAGSLFKLTGYPVASQNREYLITCVSFSVAGPQYESQAGGGSDPYKCSLVAIESHCPFRLEPRTPRPTVPGPQTATVVGAKDQDITTDRYGRVKVKFHWDRRKGNKNEKDKDNVDKNGNDPDSSCWIRVAQVWAGAGFGVINIPRIGEEVIVDFLEGDPDRPIITGRVYNQDHMPPYTLEKNKTQTGIKTRSTKDGTEQNFNEILFEDLKGQEKLHMQAERDMSTNVKRNQSTSVGADRSVSVGGNQSTSVTHNDTWSVKGERKMTVEKTNTETITLLQTGTYKAGRTEEVTAGDTLKVTSKDKKISVLNGAFDIDVNTHLLVKKADTTMTIDDNFVVDATGKVDLHNPGTKVIGEGTKLALSANSELTITCGASSISLKSDGTIEIKGQTVKIGNASNNAAFEPAGTTINGVKITSAATGMHEISGALIKVG